jgi:uncharacterized protein (DUF1697 family)
MPRYLAPLRGINVGGCKKVAMTDLRQIATGLGHADVATYIQSGNMVFTRRWPHRCARRRRGGGDRRQLSVQPVVVVLSRDELAEVIVGNPFPDEPTPSTCTP